MSNHYVVLEPEEGFIVLKERKIKEVSGDFVSKFKGMKSSGYLIRHKGRIYHEKTEKTAKERGRLLKGGDLYKAVKGNAKLRCFSKVGVFKTVSDDDAMQALLGDILVTKSLESISKADPLDPDDFSALVVLMWKDYDKATKVTDAEYEKFFFSVVDKVDWTEATTKEINSAVKVMNSYLPESMPSVQKKVKAVIIKNGTTVYTGTKKAMKKDMDLDISTTFNLADKKAINAISNYGMNYIPKSFKKQSEYLSGVVQRNVEYGLRKGFSSSEIAGNVYDALGVKIPTRRNTWIKLASHAAVARARSRSQILSYQEADVMDRVIFDAVMDEATTEICAFFDGKVIDLILVDKQWTAMEEDDGDFEDTFPWLTQSKKGGIVTISSNGKSIASGTSGSLGFSKGMDMSKAQISGNTYPPLHPFCRSSTYIE